MPNFEHYNVGESKDEAERLYGNDISPKKFSGKPYISAAELPGTTGLYGEPDDLSSEDKFLNNDELLSLGKMCDDYLNDKAELPADVTEEEARELAIIYRDSLSEKKKREIEKEVNSSRASVRQTEIVDLKRGQVAKATPDHNEKVKLDRRSQQQYVAKKLEKAL